MFAVIFYKDGSSENVYPKDGFAFGQYELASKNKNIAFINIYGDK